MKQLGIVPHTLGAICELHDQETQALYRLFKALQIARGEKGESAGYCMSDETIAAAFQLIGKLADAIQCQSDMLIAIRAIVEQSARR